MVSWGGEEPIMSQYWVTFRIAQDATYDKRYAGLMQALIDVRTGSWSETTSFLLVNSPLGLNQVAAAFAKPLNSSTDLLVVCEMFTHNSVYLGDLEYSDIFKGFLPFAKKLP
jgi:hypothetical protein